MKKTVKIRCIKDGYNITKGKLYDIEVYSSASAISELKYKTSVYVEDDKGFGRYYLSEFFIDGNDKQTWRELQLKELI